MNWFPLSIFPEGALASSVIVTVWVGVTIVAITNLRLGWVLSGLVIPGYMVPLLIAKPMSATVVFAEGIVTYALVWLYSEYSTRFTGFSSFFGRDRFFALVLTSVAVRIVADGWLLPEFGEWMLQNYDYAFDYRNNLHSFGLIIVALIGNNFWKTGLIRGLWPMAVQVGLTWFVVRYVLMEATNFNIASLAFMYEDSASSFLATPKAYIIVLVTAFIASRLNLFYGWDFSGILIPSLLALQWFEPFKILTTLAEAAVILMLAELTLRLPIFRNITIEGARKLLLFFNLSFAYKFILSWVLILLLPDTRVTDWFGFGYLLATLLAIKMHDKGLFARMTAATIQTSFAGIAVATLIGFLLVVIPDPAWKDSGRNSAEPLAPIRRIPGELKDVLLVEKTGFYAATLKLSNNAPLQKELDAFATGVRRLLEYRRSQQVTTLEAARVALIFAGYEVAEVGGKYLLLQPRPKARQWGSFVLRLKGDSALLVGVPAPVDEPGAFEVGISLFHRFEGRAFATAGSARRSGNDGALDVLTWPQTMFQVFHRELAPREVLQVRTNAEGVGSVIYLSGQLPESFDVGAIARVATALKVEFSPHPEKNLQRQTLRGQFSELWMSPTDALRIGRINSPSITDPRELLDRSFATLLRDSVTASTVAPSNSERYGVRSQEELLRIDREVLSPLLRLVGVDKSDLVPLQENQTAFVAVQASAASLGLRLRWLAHLGSEHFLLEDLQRAGGWIAIRLGATRNFIVEVPRPIFEAGVLEVSLSAFTDLQARAIIFAGAAPDANRNGSADILARSNAQSLFTLAHQVILREMGDDPGIAMMVRAMGFRPDQPAPPEDALLAFDLTTVGRDRLPALSSDLVSSLEQSGLSIRLTNGSTDTGGYSATGVPQATYMNQTRDKRFAVLWVSPLARRQTDAESVALQRRQFLALDLSAKQVDAVAALRGWQLVSGGIPSELRLDAERYVFNEDIVLLSSMRQRYPALRLERMDDTGGRGAFLLIFDLRGGLRAVMSLSARSVPRDLKLRAGPISAADAQQFLSTRFRWMIAS